MTILAVINTKDLVVRVFDGRILVDMAQLHADEDITQEDQLNSLRYLLSYNQPGKRLARQAAELLAKKEAERKMKKKAEAVNFAPAKQPFLNFKYSLPNPV
jgi:hypothetical protein